MRTMLALVAAALMLPAAARADALSFAIPPGSKWTHAYITEAHGTKLHADILRPANLPASAKTPVIISIGPYFNHSGQTGPAGPVEGTPYTPVGEAGPSARFFDYINGAKLLPQGRHRAGHVSGERGRDQRRHVARGGQLAAGRLHVRRHHAQPRCLRRRRAEQRHGRGRRAQRPGRLDDLAALDRGRAPRRRAEGQRRRGSAPGDANLVVDVYDIDSGRNATLISRGAYLLGGNELASFDLYGDDWWIPAGHRVGVLVTGANAEWWQHVPTGGTVTVRDARLELPFLRCTRTDTIQGGPSVKQGIRAVQRPGGHRRAGRARGLPGAHDERVLTRAILTMCPHRTTSWPRPPSGPRSPRSPSATATT
jgi:hypothetical protein